MALKWRYPFSSQEFYEVGIFGNVSLSRIDPPNVTEPKSVLCFD